jgi:hypothetical protein
MLKEKSAERKSQSLLKKKGTALLAGYFGLLGIYRLSRRELPVIGSCFCQLS